MTLGYILESGYGIDVSTLQFSTTMDVEDCGTREEIIKSICENEIVITNWFETKRFNYDDDFDILDYDKETLIYLKGI